MLRKNSAPSEGESFLGWRDKQLDITEFASDVESKVCFSPLLVVCRFEVNNEFVTWRSTPCILVVPNEHRMFSDRAREFCSSERENETEHQLEKLPAIERHNLKSALNASEIAFVDVIPTWSTHLLLNEKGLLSMASRVSLALSLPYHCAKPIEQWLSLKNVSGSRSAHARSVMLALILILEKHQGVISQPRIWTREILEEKVRAFDVLIDDLASTPVDHLLQLLGETSGDQICDSNLKRFARNIVGNDFNTFNWGLEISSALISLKKCMKELNLFAEENTSAVRCKTIKCRLHRGSRGRATYIPWSLIYLHDPPTNRLH